MTGNRNDIHILRCMHTAFPYVKQEHDDVKHTVYSTQLQPRGWMPFRLLDCRLMDPPPPHTHKSCGVRAPAPHLQGVVVLKMSLCHTQQYCTDAVPGAVI
jgi:hypothetical protein